MDVGSGYLCRVQALSRHGTTNTHTYIHTPLSSGGAPMLACLLPTRLTRSYETRVQAFCLFLFPFSHVGNPSNRYAGARWIYPTLFWDVILLGNYPYLRRSFCANSNREQASTSAGQSMLRQFSQVKPSRLQALPPRQHQQS